MRSISATLVTCLFVGCGFGVLKPAVAQEATPMSVEDVLSLRSLSDPQISPDGRWVAYVVGIK